MIEIIIKNSPTQVAFHKSNCNFKEILISSYDVDEDGDDNNTCISTNLRVERAYFRCIQNRKQYQFGQREHRPAATYLKIQTDWRDCQSVSWKNKNLFESEFL